MKATAKHKVVTSGRLTGGGRVQLTRKQVSPHPGPAAGSEPAYSLYSTDSEDQVTTLHQGLDRCAALLSGILQADEAAPASLPRAVTGGAARSRPSTSVGKKALKKPQRKTVQKNPQSCQRGPGTVTPRPGPRSPAAHSGVKLHPPQRLVQTLLQSHPPPSHSQRFQYLSTTTPPSKSQTSTPPSKSQTSTLPSKSQTSTLPSKSQTSIPPLQPQASVLLSVVQSSSHSGQLPVHQPDFLSEALPTHCDTECDVEEEEESVPVRDIDPQSTHTLSHIHTCTRKMSNTHLDPGPADEVPQDSESRETCRPDTCRPETCRAETVQYLLGELKALIAGRGSVAERLLSHLEQTVSSPLMNIQTETDPHLNQNIQVHRQVMLRNQQLKDKERHKNMEMLFNSEVTALQQELTAAQSRLQEVQDDLAELRSALQDTQSQLRDREAENTVIRTELEAVRSRLEESEREKSELASLVQQRLEEIGNLNRILQNQDSSGSPTLVDSSGSDTNQQQRPAETAPERITQYLRSLDQLGPTHTEPKTLIPVHLRETRSHKPAETSACHLNPHLDPSWRPEREQVRLQDCTVSQCDIESVWSDWTMRSGSTFDTRDEAAFRDGLAALDASIASLQKTIQLDLKR
ncbi:coiled-coil domain-containing protein 14 [Seriola lalandi dorsalis]|uniref:coiled-coil domain-containing protein 14 n=1 Tax=Seriola lalandi dorsalis TaxID=1841481 RepID=UPI000C6F8A57|nr:coiled-coil domain-containing protein 14 [Seriola lalandi dorsalis]